MNDSSLVLAQISDGFLTRKYHVKERAVAGAKQDMKQRHTYILILGLLQLFKKEVHCADTDFHIGNFGHATLTNIIHCAKLFLVR